MSGLFITAVQSTGDDNDYRNLLPAPYAPSGRITTELRPQDTVVTIEEVPNFITSLDGFTRGGAAYLGSEIVSVVDVLSSSETDATIRILVERGAIDTVPAQSHAVGTVILLYERSFARVGTSFGVGEEVFVKPRSTSSYGTLNLNAAIEDSIVITQRRDRPYPPGKIEINGQPYGVANIVSGDLVVDWAHRNRITQGDQLIGHLEDSITPEVGTTYTVNIRKASDDTLIQGNTGITGDTYTYTEAEATADGFETDIILEIFALRDSLESHQKYRIPLKHFPAADASGYGFDYGNNYGG